MVASEDIAGRGVTVTIKYGAGFDQPWLVFRGLPQEVRDDLIESFGLDRAENLKIPLSGVVLNATQVAHAKGSIGSTLGATSVSESASDSTSAKPSAPASTNDEAQADPWASATEAAQEAAAKEEAADPNKILRDTIDGISSLDDLKALWADNQEAFKDAELLAHWKARGKALKAS